MTISKLHHFFEGTEGLSVSVGNHLTREQGMCTMEMVAWIAGHPHSDRPRCTSAMIAAYVRHLNDNMPEHVRPQLIPFITKLIDTAGSESLEQERSAFFAWQAVRVLAPVALRVGGRSMRQERLACVLERQTNFREAMTVTGRIHGMLTRHFQNAQDWSPVAFAVYRAHQAARAADWFAAKRDDFFGGASSITPYDACAVAAAGAAFQAYRAGCEDVWSLALRGLDDVLLI